MKKKFTIEVDIDTEEKGDVSKVWAQRNDTTKWFVEIRDDSNILGLSSHVIAHALAHELGHFVAFACDLPKIKIDPRFTSDVMLSNVTYDQAVLDGENEAWDMAEVMFTIPASRKRAIQSYENSFNPFGLPSQLFYYGYDHKKEA